MNPEKSLTRREFLFGAAATLIAGCTAVEKPREFDPYWGIPLARYYAGPIRIKLPEVNFRTGPTTTENHVYWKVSRDKIRSINGVLVNAEQDTIIVTNPPITYGSYPVPPLNDLHLRDLNQPASWVILMGNVEVEQNYLRTLDMYVYLGTETEGVVDGIDYNGRVLAANPVFSNLKIRESDKARLDMNSNPIALGLVRRIS